MKQKQFALAKRELFFHLNSFNLTISKIMLKELTKHWQTSDLEENLPLLDSGAIKSMLRKQRN